MNELHLLVSITLSVKKKQLNDMIPCQEFKRNLVIHFFITNHYGSDVLVLFIQHCSNYTQ